MVLNQGLADKLPDAVLVIDFEGVLHGANEAAERLFGVSAEERVGVSCLDLIHPGDLEMALAAMTSMSSQEFGRPIELRVHAEDGWRLVELLGAQVDLVDAGEGIALCLRDLTDRRMWELASGDEAVFRSVLQNAVGLTMLLTTRGEVLTTSTAVTRALGHDQASISESTFVDLVVDEDRVVFHRAFARALRGEHEVSFEARLLQRSDDAPVPFQLKLVNLLDDPTVQAIVLTGHEITELREAREELARLAFIDALTGLPNRGDLMRELATRLRPRRGEDLEVVIAFIDLDRFKPVNDLFGHGVGDELLVAMAKRLRSRLPASDYLSRFGGDEFVVLADPTGHDSTAGLVTRLEAAAAEPFALSVGTVQVFASVGVVGASSGDKIEEVLAEADAAMYAEKHRRRGIESGRGRSIGERRALAESLETAFDNNEFELWYQPIVALRGTGVDGRPNGPMSCEALVRWRHPERGLLSPAEFLDVIEDVGRDNELAAYVLRGATRDLAFTRELTGLDLSFAVNASVNQFTDPRFPRLVEQTVRAAGVPASALTIEVSERSIMERPAIGAAVTAGAGLEAIAATGVKLAVDDFGTGYSSLSHLVAFPIDTIKVDRSFVARMLDESQCRSVVTALIGLARSMRVEIVAEGVETTEQLDLLSDLGCDLAQGYLFRRPAPLASVLEWLGGVELTGGASSSAVATGNAAGRG